MYTVYAHLRLDGLLFLQEAEVEPSLPTPAALREASRWLLRGDHPCYRSFTFLSSGVFLYVTKRRDVLCEPMRAGN